VVAMVQEQLVQQEQEEHWLLVPMAEVLELKSSCIEILAPCQVLLLGICRCLLFGSETTRFVLKVSECYHLGRHVPGGNQHAKGSKFQNCEDH